MSPLLVLVVFSFLSLEAYGVHSAPCPCQDTSLCKPISGTPEKEILGFVTSQENWPHYNWSALTTVVLFTEEFNNSLLCYAHSKGVRVVLSASYPTSELQNFTGVRVSSGDVARASMIRFCGVWLYI